MVVKLQTTSKKQQQQKLPTHAVFGWLAVAILLTARGLLKSFVVTNAIIPKQTSVSDDESFPTAFAYQHNSNSSSSILQQLPTVKCKDIDLSPERLEYLDAQAPFNNGNPTNVSLPWNSLGFLDDDNNNNTIEYALCHFDRRNGVGKWIKLNIAHTLQWFSPCWSFAERVREKYPNVQLGFWNNDHDNKHKIKFHKWLVENLKQGKVNLCERRSKFNYTLHFHNNATLAYARTSKTIIYRPPTNKWKGTKRKDAWWFGQPKDALSFRSQIFFDDDETTTTTSMPKNKSQGLGKQQEGEHCSADGTIRIGLVQRKDTRRLLNIDSLQVALQANISSSWDDDTRTIVLEKVWMENMTAVEQSKWFRRQNIILAVHGAALANIVFLDPRQSAVIEIFSPPYYEMEFFSGLAQSMELAHYYQWTSSEHHPDPLAMYLELQRTQKWKYYMQFQDFAVNENEILELVVNALREQCPPPQANNAISAARTATGLLQRLRWISGGTGSA